MRRLIPILAAAVSLSFASAARADPPVWVIADEDSTITLFGSIHFLPKDRDWRPDALDAALEDADDLWFEVPIDPASELAAQQLLVQYGLAEGGGLSGLLSPHEAARLERVAGSLGISAAQLEPWRPWVAELLLSVAFIEASGWDSNSGVERTLQASTPASVERRSFETPAQQIQTLAGAPVDSQLASLNETLRQIEEEPGDLGTLVEIWSNGDTAALVSEVLEPLKKVAPVMYDRLITRRNAAWVPVIKERLAGSGQTVVVVGVGHLVGPDSVPAMLRAQGIEVTGP